MKQVIGIALLLISFVNATPINAETRGVADLSEQSFDKPVYLDYKWAFYPYKFINPRGIKNAPEYVKIGQTWDQYTLKDSSMHNFGYGTFALKIILPQPQTSYEIDIGTISSSYTIYIDNKLIKQVGNPYKGVRQNKPEFNTKIIRFKAETKQVLITFHVANYHYNRGGIWQKIKITRTDELTESRDKKLTIIFILFGGILLMSLYHGGLYLLRRKEQSSLFFFLWTMAAAFRLLFSGRYYPVLELMYIDWEWLIRIEYLSYYIAIPLFLKFTAEIFAKAIRSSIVNISVVTGSAFAILGLLVPIPILTETIYYYQIYTLLNIAYIFIILISALRKRAQGSAIFLTGFFILAITIIHDILAANQIFFDSYLFSAGLAFFVFSQAYLLASKFTGTFSRAEVLGNQLNYMNLHLEKIVDERTQKLQKANDLLQQKNEEVSRQSDQMAIMNKELRKLSVAASETDNAIIITDKNGQIEWVNRGFERLYGYSLSEMHKRFGNNLKRAGRSKKISKLFEQVLAQKKSVTYEAAVEARDGTKIQVQTTLTPITDEKGEIIYLVAIDTDIRALKSIQKELRESNTAKNKLFSIIAHDLRNPFNTILGLTELILVRYHEMNSKELLQFVKDLNEVSQKTYYLLLNLLEWSRTQRDKIVLSPAYHKLKPMLEETLEIFKTMLENKNLKAELNIHDEIKVYADQNSLKTVFRNLLSNAIKFTPRDKSIEISAIQKSEIVEVRVRDEGIGIAPENIHKLFNIENSYTSEGTEQEKGTGLGLMLCKNFVEKNNGTMHVESQLEKGTTFFIHLPVHPA